MILHGPHGLRILATVTTDRRLEIVVDTTAVPQNLRATLALFLNSKQLPTT